PGSLRWKAEGRSQVKRRAPLVPFCISAAYADQQVVKLFQRQRLAEQVALVLMAALLKQKLQLLRLFNSLGDHLQVETVSHGHDGAYDLGIIRVAGGVSDE